MNRTRLHSELEAIGCEAFLVVGRSNREPAVAAFVGTAHLGNVLIAGTRSRRTSDADDLVLLALSPLDRGEAESTGLPVISATDLNQEKPGSDGSTWSTAARLALERVGVVSGAIALAGSLEAGELLALVAGLKESGIECLPGDTALAQSRRLKEGPDLEEIRRVSGISDACFLEIARTLAAVEIRDGELWNGEGRLRVGGLRAQIAGFFALHGLVQRDGNLIAPGAQGAVPHNAGDDDRVLLGGESLVVDLFPCGRLFSDCTRTFCIGRAPEELSRAHAVTLEALHKTASACKAGARGFDLQRLAAECFSSAGYATLLDDPKTRNGYVHGLGHGVGWEVHELPHFRDLPGTAGQLEAGDVVTLEPGLYDEEKGYGVRLEDLVRVRSEGIELLTQLPYELDPRAWFA